MDNIIHFSNSWALYFGLGNLAVTKEGKGTWYSWKDSSIQVIMSTQDSTSFDWLIPPFPPDNVAPQKSLFVPILLVTPKEITVLLMSQHYLGREVA